MKKPAPSVPFSPADQAVIDWVGSYSTQMRVVGASVLGPVSVADDAHIAAHRVVVEDVPPVRRTPVAAVDREGAVQ